VLVRDDASGLRRARIDEVEAYGGPDDAASHARSGLTARNAAMFGDGVDLMRASRLTTAGRRRAARTADGRERAAAALARTPDDRLASGPGLVAASFGLDTTWSGVDLCVPGSVLRLELGDDVPDDRIVAGPRVGIDHAGAPAVGRPWRLWLADSAAVSGRSDARSG
jgi:DNA-3-methyladenine glycosylase